MQENREQTSAMQNEGIMVITSDPVSFCQYLTLQGDNATYSAGNIALAMFQLNEPTIIGTEDRGSRWAAMCWRRRQVKVRKSLSAPPAPKAGAMM